MQLVTHSAAGLRKLTCAPWRGSWRTSPHACAWRGGGHRAAIALVRGGGALSAPAVPRARGCSRRPQRAMCVFTRGGWRRERTLRLASFSARLSFPTLRSSIRRFSYGAVPATSFTSSRTIFTRLPRACWRETESRSVQMGQRSRVCVMSAAGRHTRSQGSSNTSSERGSRRHARPHIARALATRRRVPPRGLTARRRVGALPAPQAARGWEVGPGFEERAGLPRRL